MIRFLLVTIVWFPQVLFSQTIQMRVPDTTISVGATFDIPVYADQTLTGQGVFSYSLQLSYNQSLFQVISVQTAGTISAAFGTPANNIVPGMVTIAGAGSVPLTGSGRFIYIRIKALTSGAGNISFTGSQNNYFNEGLPAMTFDPGYVTVPAPAVVTISPNTGNITKGETLQFSASGGTGPYTWSVTNPVIASISSSGLLTSVQHGFTRVVAVSSQGLRDTTNGEIEIRPLKLSMPTNLSQIQGGIIDVPVHTTSVTGLGITSGYIRFTYNQNLITPLALMQIGTMLSGYPSVVANFTSPGTVVIDFAGTTPLTGSGTLVYVRFQVSPTSQGGTYLNFTDGLFNEDLLANFTNGYMVVQPLPTLSVTPSTGTLIAGQTQQFTLNGAATQPVTWTVSDPTVATISGSGLLATLKGGLITITATDALGATASTGNWQVYDTRVIMPDTTNCLSSVYVYYPIRISNLPFGQSVSSVQGTMTFNATWLSFIEMVSTGSLTQGWSWFSNATTSQVTFAGSGTTPFSASGAVVYLKFQMKPAFSLGNVASFTLSSILLNEGIPNPLVDAGGHVQGTNANLVPAITVAASANPVVSGIPVTFTSSVLHGGVSPQYQWRVNGNPFSGATNAAFTYNPVNGDIVSCMMTSSSLCVFPLQATSNQVVMNVTGLPANLALTGSVVAPQVNCFNATSVITVAVAGSTFHVQSGASATLIAGQKISMLPGTRVFIGGYLHGYIALNGTYCNTPNAPVSSGEELTISPSLDSHGPELSLFPNPAGSEVNILAITGVADEMLKMEMVDIRGRLVRKNTMLSGTAQTVDLSDLSAGLYLIRVSGERFFKTVKMVRHQ
jgi:uncharacterized protein YjdB